MSEAKRLKALEDENARLKRLLADAMLDKAVLKDIASKIVSPAAKRDAVAAACQTHGLSWRRACDILDADRGSVRYRHRRADDAPVRARLRALAAERRRFGYRRLGLLLKREGVMLNHKKLRRLYTEERLLRDCH